jgi:glycerol-3-phosphate dehydrogenase
LRLTLTIKASTKVADYINMNRDSNLTRLQTEEFDVCIIGGGASGAGCALDATLRGLKVALIEKEDFAAETSSKSTKLIHGGVRYLEQAFKNFDFAQLKQVKHGLEERHTVLANAPHLARPLALMTPVFSWIEGAYFSIGLALYGWFAKNDSLPKSKWLSKKQMVERIPTLAKNIHSAVMYYDGQLDDARYCLAIAHSAEEAGAAIANHAQVIDFKYNTDKTLASTTVKDTINNTTFQVKAKAFINCTGATADTIRLMANPSVKRRIRPSKGVHIILPYNVLNSNSALLIPKTPDGRVVFALPFEGELMVGTTDDDYKEINEEPILNEQEIDYILETLEPYMAQKVEKSQVKAGFGGLRPLIVADDRASTKSLVRDHEVEIDEKSKLISLLGGKWTTYRLMAKDTIDETEQILRGSVSACTTDKHVLVGGVGYTPNAYLELKKHADLDDDTLKHLTDKYGSRAIKVLFLIKNNPELGEKLTPQYPHLKAEVVYTAEQEMACTVRDFMARRTRLEIMDWQTAYAITPEVARLLGETLNWNDGTIEKAAAEYRLLLDKFKRSANM